MPANDRRNHALWLGPLLGLIGLASYFLVVIQIGWRSMSDLPWLNLLVVAAAVVVSGVGAVRAWQVRPAALLKRALSVLGVAFSGFTAFALAGYLFVLSSEMPDAAQAVPAGEPLPIVSLLDNRGAAFDLAGAANRNVVLVFYRGFW